MPLYLPSRSIQLGYAESSTDASVTGLTAVDVSGLSITATPTGLPVTIIVDGTLVSAAGGSAFVRILEGSTTKKKSGQYCPATFFMDFHMEYTYVPAAGSSLTWKVQIEANGAGESVQFGYSAASVSPHSIRVFQG